MVLPPRRMLLAAVVLALMGAPLLALAGGRLHARHALRASLAGVPPPPAAPAVALVAPAGERGRPCAAHAMPARVCWPLLCCGGRLRVRSCPTAWVRARCPDRATGRQAARRQHGTTAPQSPMSTTLQPSPVGPPCTLCLPMHARTACVPPQIPVQAGLVLCLRCATVSKCLPSRCAASAQLPPGTRTTPTACSLERRRRGRAAPRAAGGGRRRAQPARRDARARRPCAAPAGACGAAAAHQPCGARLGGRLAPGAGGRQVLAWRPWRGCWRQAAWSSVGTGRAVELGRGRCRVHHAAWLCFMVVAITCSCSQHCHARWPPLPAKHRQVRRALCIVEVCLRSVSTLCCIAQQSVDTALSFLALRPGECRCMRMACPLHHAVPNRLCTCLYRRTWTVWRTLLLVSRCIGAIGQSLHRLWPGCVHVTSFT